MSNLTVVGLYVGEDTIELGLESYRSIRLNDDQVNLLFYCYSCQLTSYTRQELLKLRVGIINLMTLQPQLSSFSQLKYSQYETSEFNQITSLKWLVIMHSLKSLRESSILFVDSDIQFYSHFPYLDFINILSSFSIFAQDEGTQVFPRKACTGLLGFSNTISNKRLIATLYLAQLQALGSGLQVHDQDIFNHFIHNNPSLHKDIYFLSNVLFPTGISAPMFKNYDLDKGPIKPCRLPIAFHANCVVGIDKKRQFLNAMRK